MFITLKMSVINCKLDTALFRVLSKEHNLAYSPYAIFVNLNAATAGARHETLNEIVDLIQGYNATAADERLVHEVIYLNKRLNVVKCFRKDLNIPIRPLDYRNKDLVVELINTYVKKYTEARVTPNIVLKDKLRAKTLMNIVAVHKIDATWEKPFTTQTENISQITMHLSDKFLYRKLKNLNAIAVEIPFKTPETRLLVIMPNDQNLDRLGKNLLKKDLSKIARKLKMTKLNLSIRVVTDAAMEKSVRKEFSQVISATI